MAHKGEIRRNEAGGGMKKLVIRKIKTAARIIGQRLKSKLASIAQWIEHFPPKEGVARSIRAGGASRQK